MQKKTISMNLLDFIHIEPVISRIITFAGIENVRGFIDAHPTIKKAARNIADPLNATTKISQTSLISAGLPSSELFLTVLLNDLQKSRFILNDRANWDRIDAKRKKFNGAVYDVVQYCLTKSLMEDSGYDPGFLLELSSNHAGAVVYLALKSAQETEYQPIFEDLFRYLEIEENKEKIEGIKNKPVGCCVVS